MIVAAAVAFAVTALVAGPLLPLLRGAGLQRLAFDGRPLPTAAGLAPVLGLVAGLGLLEDGPARGTLVAALGAALWGLLDDVAGHRGARGWSSHLPGLWRGWTSGTAKMVGVGLTGWAATGTLTGALGVALAANLVNVCDCRPTRALKVAWLAALPLAAWGAPDTTPALLAWVGATLAWFPWDAGRRAMLGDTGANALGAALGCLAAQGLPPAAGNGWLLAAAVLQLAADRWSLSRLIQRIPGLSWLDRLGVCEGTSSPVTNTQ